jgi:hypothetical protein
MHVVMPMIVPMGIAPFAGLALAGWIWAASERQQGQASQDHPPALKFVTHGDAPVIVAMRQCTGCDSWHRIGVYQRCEYGP